MRHSTSGNGGRGLGFRLVADVFPPEPWPVRGAFGGQFVYDLCVRWAAKPAQNSGAGALVRAQLWYRDPLNTSNQTTSLSNAIEFSVCP